MNIITLGQSNRVKISHRKGFPVPIPPVTFSYRFLAGGFVILYNSTASIVFTFLSDNPAVDINDFQSANGGRFSAAPTLLVNNGGGNYSITFQCSNLPFPAPPAGVNTYQRMEYVNGVDGGTAMSDYVKFADVTNTNVPDYPPNNVPIP